MRDHGLADRIRAKAVPVVEVGGWHDRGDDSPFTPRGVVDHHTAGPALGTIPSLGTLIGGRSDLPGPLCSVGQSREDGEGNDKAYVIASGRANHAGRGGWRGLVGNSSVHGLEVEHTGLFPLPAHRIETAARITAAMLEAPGSSRDAGMSCQHFEWAPTRKIDIATRMDAAAFRSRVAFWIGRTAEEEQDMDDTQDKRLKRVETMLEELLLGWRDSDGVKIPPGVPAGRLKELVVGLRDEDGVPIPNARVGKRIKRIDANVTDLVGPADEPPPDSPPPAS